MNTHPLKHVLSLSLCSQHMFLPYILFHFHHSHQVWTIEEDKQSQFETLLKTNEAIYSQRSSSPRTFSHLIPYCKVSPSNNLVTHSLMNWWCNSISLGIESKGILNNDNPSPRDEEATGGGTQIRTLFSNSGETSQGADNEKSLLAQSMALTLHFLIALWPLNSWYKVSPIFDDPLLGVACLLQISNLLFSVLLSSLGDKLSLWPSSEQCCPVPTGPM